MPDPGIATPARASRRFVGHLAVCVALLVGCRGRADTAVAPTWTDPSPHRIQFVTVAPGVSLEVLDWGGSGAPLVFLSGLQDVAHGFDDFAPQFADRFHVLAITRRGYGASSQPAGGYDIATRFADLRAVLDSLHLPRVALAGHSIAGDELTAFAGAEPGRVSQLIYLDAGYDHSGLGAFFGDYPAPPPMLAADSASPVAVQAYTRRVQGVQIPEAQIRAIGKFDVAGRLVANVTDPVVDSLMLAGCGHPDWSAVHAPALIIDAVIDSAPQLFPRWEEYDSAAQAAGRRFGAVLMGWAITERAIRGRGMPGATVLALHDANHYVFDSHRERVAAAMRDFLAAHADQQ